jgi:hypothetical protein
MFGELQAADSTAEGFPADDSPILPVPATFTIS